MRVLLVHPGPLLYSEIFLRLEPLGRERVASAARFAGHEVRVVDLQVCSRSELEAELQSFRPEAVGFGLNYLANVPEVLELGAEVKRRLPSALPSRAATASHSSLRTCLIRRRVDSTRSCAATEK